MTNQHKNISKLLSLVLRHKPETLGISLSPQGWTNIDELILAINNNGTVLDRKLLDEIVADNDKQRFTYSADKFFIRANQGHSIAVDWALKTKIPPQILFHGTATRFIKTIKRQGFIKMQRQHVHLSATKESAIKVGQRHGKPQLLCINTKKMIADGYHFYLSKNSVWLVEKVPAQYIAFDA
jgi:putative RNA 2'-phosphotransferase